MLAIFLHWKLKIVNCGSRTVNYGLHLNSRWPISFNTDSYLEVAAGLGMVLAAKKSAIASRTPAPNGKVASA